MELSPETLADLKDDIVQVLLNDDSHAQDVTSADFLTAVQLACSRYTSDSWSVSLPDIAHHIDC